VHLLFVRCRSWVGPTGYRGAEPYKNREIQIKHWGALRLDMLVARAGSLASNQQRWPANGARG
jgi:hypothetical protein